MKTQKIDESNALKPGQLLATWSEWRFQSFFPFPNPGRCQLQFYRHRRDSVPGTRRPKRRRNFRHPRTANERRAGFTASKNRECHRDPELAYTVRKKRSPNRLPDLYDDVWTQYQRNWKENRGRQWKEVGVINRHVHAPPFWTPSECIGTPRYRDVAQVELSGVRNRIP